MPPASPSRSVQTPTANFDKPWLLPPPRKYKLINANIIDPVKGQIIENAVVSLANGRIEAITEGNDPTLVGAINESNENSTPDEEQVIDLKGLFLCPGLIDAHVHVTATPGEQGLKNTYKAIPASMNHYRTTYVVREMLARGFTTVRDCGGADAALKQAIDEWLIIGPRLNIAGHALSQTGGHGDQRDAHQDDDHQCCSGQRPGISRLCDGEAECIVAVRDEMRKGADFIKIMAGGGVSSRLNNLAHAQFLPGEISAITQTAESFDTYVTAHAYSNRAMRHAVENGARGIEHGNFLDEETAVYLASKDVFFTPTLATSYTLMKPPFDQWITEDLMKKNVRVMKLGLRSLEIAGKVGLTVCFGSDLMASMQPFQNNEFSIRAQVQSSLDVLRSATIHPARMMKMEGDIGRVAEGLFADLLVLKLNPLVDIRVLDDPGNILAVVKEGRKTFMPDVVGIFAGTPKTGGAMWPYRFVTHMQAALPRKYPAFSIDTHTSALNITKSTGSGSAHFEVKTPRGTIRARHVVHTAGAGIQHLLLKLDGPLTQARWPMTTQSVGDKIADAGYWPALFLNGSQPGGRDGACGVITTASCSSSPRRTCPSTAVASLARSSTLSGMTPRL